MSFGDIGGRETWRAMTMRTPSSGTISIAKGDAVSLVGNEFVDNAFSAEDAVIGEALASVSENDALVPVKVAGVSEFSFTGAVPVVDGLAGVLASATAGKVKKPASGNGVGRNLNVAISQATLSLATVLADDTVTINGLTFTAHTDTTTAANREFAISGTDTQDAAALAGLINDATYGVPGVTATPSVADIVLVVDDASKTRIVASSTGGTITVAEDAGRVRVLL